MKWLILALALAGCATVKEAATSPDTFALCKAADVATTVYGLNSGHFVETNPLLKLVIGPHNFFPLIAFSLAAYWVIQHYNQPAVTATANVITCGVAAHNGWLLR